MQTDTRMIGDKARRVDDNEEHADGRWRRWSLIGPRGAVSFAYIDRRPNPRHEPFDMGVHSHSFDRREHDLDGPGDCDVLPGGQCYGDGSYLLGAKLVREWAASDWDEDVVWAELEECYDAWLPGL